MANQGGRFYIVDGKRLTEAEFLAQAKKTEQQKTSLTKEGK